MGDRLQTGEPYKGLAGAAVSPVLIASWGRDQKKYAICVTRGFMGSLGGFWPKLGRKRVTGWKQRSCVPPRRVKTNKQTYHTMPFLKWYVLLWPLRPELDDQGPFQICGGLCQTRKTPTLVYWKIFLFWVSTKKLKVLQEFVDPKITLLGPPDRKVDIKDNHLGIKLIPMISTWDQVDPIFPVRGLRICETLFFPPKQ
jgi:hypothetical protein